MKAVSVGRILGDRWKIVREIGSGGTATVYEAVHRNGRRVAIKVLRPELLGNRAARKRFESEGYAANRVQHPHAVAVLDDGQEADGTVFLVMELLDGNTLTTPLREGRALPLVVVGMVGMRVLDVLAAAHDHGVVHRDVKPGNIFVTRDGQIKLLDFGVAHVGERFGMSVITKAGATIGTPEFMAPEQAAGRVDDVDALTDIWAVGATIFQLLTRRLVHEVPAGKNAIIVAATTPAPPLRSLAPHISEELAQVVDRALAFERSQRWPNARAMRQALIGALPDLASRSATESIGAITAPESSRRFRAPGIVRRSEPPLASVPPSSAPSPRKHWPVVLFVVAWSVLLGAAGVAWYFLRARHW